jgi:FkbM family methyltransferase
VSLAERARFSWRAWRARWRDQRAELREVLARIRPGDCVADIGANKGAYLYWMRRAAGASGKVYAFEPQPALHAYLVRMAGQAGWDNVTVLPFALSDRRGSAQIHVPGERGTTSPGASLEPRQGAHSISCQLETLDEVLRGGARLSFIKCDVEGHELAMFRGARRILAEQGPALLFECEARHLTGHGMREVFDFLRGLGYSGAFFTEQGLLPVERFDPAEHQRSDGERFWDRAGYCNNFLFTR